MPPSRVLGLTLSILDPLALNMASFKTVFSGLAFMAASANAAIDMGDTDEMGPAAFMWPADRVWSAAMDNTAPCGSVANPGNRSEFPMRMSLLKVLWFNY